MGVKSHPTKKNRLSYGEAKYSFYVEVLLDQSVNPQVAGPSLSAAHDCLSRLKLSSKGYSILVLLPGICLSSIFSSALFLTFYVMYPIA
jgi:hypothetical protein